MELYRYLNVLRKHLASIVLLTLLGGVAAYVFSQRQPKVYEATASLLINEAAPSYLIPYLGTSLNGNTGVAPLDQLTNTYSIFLQSRSFDALAVRKLHLAMTPEELGSQISSARIPNTNYFTISIRSNNPAQAAALANGVARLFVEENAAAQAKMQSAGPATEIEQSIIYFRRRIKVLQKRLDALVANPHAQPSQVSGTNEALVSMEDTYYRLLGNAGTSAVLAGGGNTAALSDPAVLPDAPLFQHVTRNALSGLLGGLVIGLALAFLLDYLDYSLRTPEDLEQLTGQAPLAVIGRFVAGGRRTRRLFGLPFKAMVARATDGTGRPVHGNGHAASGAHRRNGALNTPSVLNPLLVTLTRPHAPASEAFRTLRTNLDFSSLDRPLKSLVVTSAARGEGKSTVAANVAITMAQAGKRIILVDANLRHPSLGALFNLTAKAGLTTALLERGDQAWALGEALQMTMVPNLRVMPSGPQPPNPAELLASESMTALLRDLEARADLVIFDTPNMGPFTDAVVLSARVSGTLLAVRAGSTRRTVITNSLNALRKVGGTVVGTVLTMVDMKASSTYAYDDYQPDALAAVEATASGGLRGA